MTSRCVAALLVTLSPWYPCGDPCQIEFVLHARIPLLKFVHGSTGIECDLTVQSYDGALKGRFMAAIAQLDTRWGVLYLCLAWSLGSNRLHVNIMGWGNGCQCYFLGRCWDA